MIGAKYFISGEDTFYDDELGFTRDESEDPDIHYDLAGGEIYQEPHELEDLTAEED